MKTRLTHLCLLSSTLLASLPAQSTPPAEAPAAPEIQPSAAPNPASEPDAPAVERGRLRRGNFNPADIQERMMSSLREQMGVKDDTEWALITERITAVTELRRPQIAGAIGAMFGGRGGNRASFAASPEQDALRSALADNLPDAEITARLAKLREARKQHETKLDQARENLRAVLTVRQEAVAVMVGLLN